jgi:hypothetical protein
VDLLTKLLLLLFNFVLISRIKIILINSLFFVHAFSVENIVFDVQEVHVVVKIPWKMIRAAARYLLYFTKFFLE